VCVLYLTSAAQVDIRRFPHASSPQMDRTLNRKGLGSAIHLINTIDDTFSHMNPIKPLETVPNRQRTTESLETEPVPQIFHNRQDYGGFALAPSFIQISSSKKPSSSMIETDPTASASQRTHLTASLQELDYLNSLVALNEVKGLGHLRQEGIHPDALRYASFSQSGSTTVDLPGICSEAFASFRTESPVATLTDCWDTCKKYTACTQVHFIGGKCHLSMGVSTRAVSGDSSTSVCRSLTAAGLRPAVGLPVFKVLGNVAVKLVSVDTRPFEFLASTLPECQSACLGNPTCAYGAWVLDAEKPQKSLCFLGADIEAYDPDLATPIACKEGFKCQPVCGTSNCILFAQTQGSFVSTRNLATAKEGSVIKRTPSCEDRCAGSVGSACASVCIARERTLCQLVSTEPILVFTYGNKTDQVCASGNINSSHATHVEYFSRIDSTLVEKTTSLVQGAGSTSNSLTNIPNFTTFQGACGVFDEGLLLGSGPGLSKFAATSIDECWSLCQEFMPECTQVQFHIGSRECTLGDAITSTFNMAGETVCRSLDYMPIDSTNGLPGMMFTDSVGDAKIPTTGDSYWFSGATTAQAVGSLEECQALCKAVDSNSGGETVCRYGGFSDCASFFTSVCPTSEGMGHPDCALCQTKPNGGVCRIPQLPAQSLGGPSSTAVVNTPAPVCLGGQCRWFEQSKVGFSLTIKTPTNPKVDFLPSSGLICDSGVSYLPAPITDSASTDHPNHQCYYPVESLWHCQSLCSAVNQFNGSGKNKCIGGLYADSKGTKKCYIAQYRLGTGQACVEGSNCGWFELDGKGDLDELQDTGMALAAQARSQSNVPYDMGIGPCIQFKAFGPRINKYVSQVVYGDAVKECSTACSMFPQCVAFQVTGQIVGPNPNACDLTKLNATDCTSVECVLSSTITGIAPSNNTNQICWSKTPSGTVQLGEDEIDMENVDPGLPGFFTINARVRKFGWQNVFNSAKLAVTASMEECQAVCRATDGCITGSWQVCSAIQQYCARGQQLNDMTPEVTATCNACGSIFISPQQPAAAFPANYGVCKLSQTINDHIEGCQPEPCYSFEAGSDQFYILSMTKNPFTAEGSPGYMLNNELNAYVKTKSLEECQSFCTPAIPNDPTDPRSKCKYGLYIPRANGYGECYLTELEIRENHGSYWQLTQKTTVNCEGTCIVFIKLKNEVPAMFSSSNSR